MFRRLNLHNDVNRNKKLIPEHNDSINIGTIISVQKHKLNPHEPTFLNKSQFEELCKYTYDGNVPFTITRIVDTNQGVEETKTDAISVEEIKEEKSENLDLEHLDHLDHSETYKYKKPVKKKIKKEK